ncbi:MAG: ATP-binding cassette domain-containing protein, partial [Clostridia bacterium]
MSLSFGMETIYDDAEFQIADFDKVGIVGVNGAGKTTLFKVILRELELDSGAISVGNAKIGYLPQEIDFEDRNKKVWDYLFEARPIKKIEAEVNDIYEKLVTANEEEQIKLLSILSKLQQRLDNLDVYNAENTLLELIDNMKIDDALLDMEIGNLSGGQKSKVAFAYILFSDPKILLLDEPT